VDQFNRLVISNGSKQENRTAQEIYWMNETVKETLLHNFLHAHGVKEKLKEIEEGLKEGKLTSYQAAENILNYYNEQRNI
jgi:LAO/AO transport system kinase